LFDEEIDHLADRNLGRLIQVLVESHGDVVRRGFSARPQNMNIFAHNELERASQGSFECREMHLAVALARMAVADLEESPFCENGKEERRARNQVLVIEGACVNPGWAAADAPGDFRRGYSDASEKRMQRDFDAFAKHSDHAFLVQWDDFPSCVWEILREQAAAGHKRVEGIAKGDSDILDANFQDITRLGALDVDRSVQDMPAGAFIVDLAVDVPQRLFDLARLGTCGFELIRAETD